MKRIEGLPEALFGQDKSVKDTDRLFSVLLDSRIVKTSASMCDTAERLVAGEKENAKVALDQLWEMKKNMVVEKNGTIDLLIAFYQEKIDVLRAKEEHIKNVSKDSRELLEEKRQRDSEMTSVKQEIANCTQEITDLNGKLEQLSRKEQELIFIDQHLKKELGVNENEIVNGLYEIILAERIDEGNRTGEERDTDGEQTVRETPVAPIDFTPAQPPSSSLPPAPEAAAGAEEASRFAPVEGVPVSRSREYEEKPPFPRSIVKTTRGRVIGEYFYDGEAAKAERHYIFNSKFFARIAADYLQVLKARFDEPTFCELLQMMQDASKRISASDRIHFEVSTNEILNEKTLDELLFDVKKRSFDEVERFCARLSAKIEALGRNYPTMLKEQMERCFRS